MIDYPYPGMRPFSREEAEIFFGREQQTYDLVDRLGERRFLAVVGASGSGKSSLVKAGLIAGLESGLLARAGTRWTVAEMRPQRDPFAELARALGDDNAADALKHSSLGLHQWLATHPPGARFLLMVDQFEELFRYAEHHDSIVAEAFAALLLASARVWPEGETDIYVVITMRSDFLGECARFRGLAEAINDGLYLTPRLNREQLRLAMEEPALVSGCEIDAGLISRLFNDAGDDPDQLPLLQHSLQMLWLREKEQDPPHLRLADYEQHLKNPGAALNQRLENIYQHELDDAQKNIAETLFRHLARRDSEQRDIRRHVTAAEMMALAGAELGQVQAVVDAFRGRGRDFLLPAQTTRPQLRPADVLDVCHESLLRQWDTLRDWLKDEARSAEIYARLSRAAQLWGEGKGDLWRDLELSNAALWWQDKQPTAAWAARYSQAPFEHSREFLEASKARAARERRAYRRKAGFSIILLALIAVMMFWQWQQARRAEQQAIHAQQQAAASEQRRTEELFDASLTHAALLNRNDDYAKADEILAASRRLDPALPEARRHVRNLLHSYARLMGNPAQQVYQDKDNPLPALSSVAVSPDGALLAAGGERGTVVLFDSQSGQLLRRLEGHEPNAGQQGAVFGMAFHPLDKTLFSAGEDSQILRWNLDSSAQVSAWQASDIVNALAISPDGQLLASGGDDNNISLWDTDSGEVLRMLEGHQRYISNGGGLAFSPDGKRLASGSYDKSARIWQVADGSLLRELSGLHQGSVRVGFSPDGSLLATGSSDKRVILWNVDNGRPLRLLRGHQNIVTAPLFSADGDSLVSPSVDRTLRWWNNDSGVNLGVWQGHSAGIIQLARHGTALYSAGQDGSLRRWSLAQRTWTGDADNSGAARRLWDLPAEPFSTAISPDGTLLAIGYTSGALRLYRIPQGELLWEDTQAHGGKLVRLTFNADSSLLASAGFDDLAKVWRVNAGLRPRAEQRNSASAGTEPRAARNEIALHLQQTFSGHNGGVHGLAFSPDGQTLATASYDGRIGLFRIGAEEQAEPFAAHDHSKVDAVAFSLDGRYLLSAGGEDQSLKLWNLAATPPGLEKTLLKAQDILMWAALSPDGRHAAAVGRDQTVTVLPLAAGAAPLRLPGHEQTVYKVVFGPAGEALATVSADATLRLWDLGAGEELFSLALPTKAHPPVPLWDFDFRCVPAVRPEACIIAVPLTRGKLALYRLGY